MTLDRRTFLRTLGLTSLGIFVSNRAAKADAALLGKRTELYPVQISGMVKSAGKGLAGVVVTDGAEVTKTDDKGQYKFTSGADSEFVYVSIPRGHEFTNEKGITSFYKKIDRSTNTINADFELQKLSGDDSKHTFVVWADPQIQDEEDAKLLSTQSAPDTQALIQSYGSKQFFHGIGCGDLVWDRFDLFPQYKAALQQTGIPFFQVIGNHDMDFDARTDEFSANTFKANFGPSYYSFNRGEIHYVVLDDVFYLGNSGKYIGYIVEKQLRWLEKDLSQITPGSTVVVSVHIPVNTGAMRRNALKEEPISSVVTNRQALYKILKPFKAHIMSGHTHCNEKVFESDNIIEHVHGTVCGAWWTGPICYDGTPNGYGVYEVNGSELSWYHKAVGFDRDHQMRVYPVGAAKEKPEAFSVNVWNWDPAWKIEWFEDNVHKGELERMVALDPLSVELHAGAEKPSKRKWVDPQLTDHMFFAVPSANAQKITIQVTDRFKRICKKELTRAQFTASALVKP